MIIVPDPLCYMQLFNAPSRFMNPDLGLSWDNLDPYLTELHSHRAGYQNPVPFQGFPDVE